MGGAGGGIFGGIIEQIEILLSKFLVGFEEPVYVKGAVSQFFRGEGRVSGDGGQYPLAVQVACMGHEIVTGAGETGQRKILFQHGNPLLGVHGKLYKTLFRDICTL